MVGESLHLSLWFREFSEQTMLPYWAAVLEQFPQSSFSPGIRSLVVYPLGWAEAPILEQAFDDGADTGQVVALAAEFLHEDCAYEARLQWDVWEAQGTADRLDQWKRGPAPVAVSCLGSLFEPEEEAGRGPLQVVLGPESLFLPSEEVVADASFRESVAGSCYRDNIEQLLLFIHRLEQKLPLARRQLWSESEDDFASRIRSAWQFHAAR
jgi:hypothetical protein